MEVATIATPKREYSYKWLNCRLLPLETKQNTICIVQADKVVYLWEVLILVHCIA